jgi:uncharacterized membrane protein
MESESRPKITITLTPIDKLIEILGWLTLILLWAYTVLTYSNLPETIPTHFNAAGQVDQYGSKGTIFILPAIGMILFLGLSLLNMFPQIFNYPKNITIENAQRQYTNATRMIRYLKFAIALIFSLLVYLTSQAATDASKGIGFLFLPILLGLFIIPLIFFVLKAFKTK